MSNGRKPHFSEWVWESTEQNMAIPPREASAGKSSEPVQPSREQPQDAKPVSAKPESVKPAVQLQLWDSESNEPVTTTEREFVNRARELETFKGETALFVPFKSYWPTYGHMTGAQSRWYFFWRSEVREGRYHATDLSYIFLHVYELINGVGWQEALDGYEQLCRIWEAYRDAYKRLDQYMGGWIADFSFVHKLDVSLSQVVARSKGLAGDLAELELMRCLTGDAGQLTFQGLTFMSDYDISKSKFYTGIGQAELETYIPKVVALIDTYVSRKHGSRLLEMFPPGSPVLKERYLFRSAVYDISLYGYSVLVPVVRISKSLPLRSLVTRLFRLTENKLRELMGYRGRLKDVKLDGDMEELITQYLRREFHRAEQAEKGPAVVIDAEKLEQLQADSDVVRTLLTVQDLGYTGEADKVNEPAVERDRLDAVSEDRNQAEKNVDLSVGAPPVPDMQPWHEDQSSSASRQPQAVSPPSMPSEAYGKVYEPLSATTEGTSQSEDNGLQEPSAISEWAAFAAALTPLQREAVITLADSGNWGELQQLAAARGTMAELLADEINDIAMDRIGDLLIDGEEITPEYVTMLADWMR